MFMLYCAKLLAIVCINNKPVVFSLSDKVREHGLSNIADILSVFYTEFYTTIMVPTYFLRVIHERAYQGEISTVIKFAWLLHSFSCC